MLMWWADDDNVWSEEVYGRDRRTSSSDRERTSSGDGFRPANEQWHGYLGLNIIPAFKAFAKDALMHSFLSKMYDHEIKAMTHQLGTEGKVLSWSAVSYTPPQEPELQDHLLHRTATMNVAMPDFAAEYWNTYVPADLAPIFELEFPDWAIYSALTLYNTHGLPIASINSSQCERYLEGKGGIDRFRVSKKSGSDGKKTVFVNILGGWGNSGEKPIKGPLCALFRVYRPRHIHITPHEIKPTTYLIPRHAVDSFSCDDEATYSSGLLQVAPLEMAFANGDRMAQTFTSLINKYMKPLQAHQQGTQFFHPLSVSGLFVNPDATYVIAFVPPDKKGLIMEGSVPEWRKYRPYYGIMAVDYNTTMTVASVTFEHLGGWGSPYKVYAFRTLLEATEAGYDKTNKEHIFLCWGTEIKGPLSIVLRYLHYDMDGEEGEEGEEEKRRLCERNGDCVSNFEPIPGCPEIVYV